MSHPPAFKTKRHYALVKKYLGKPPCEKCVVRIVCFQMIRSPEDGYYEIHLKDSCDEAEKWFSYGEYLSGYIEYWIKTNNEILNLGAEQMKAEFRRLVLEGLNIDPKYYFGE